MLLKESLSGRILITTVMNIKYRGYKTDDNRVRSAFCAAQIVNSNAKIRLSYEPAYCFFTIH
jgi:hypothetical protein